jgi:recombination protein RecA
MKIGVMFGNPETTTGGNALKFYSSVRMDIRKIATLKQGQDIIGGRTRVKVVKNKTAPPFKEAEFDIMYGEGISKVGELIDLGVANDIVEKSGAWFSCNGERIGQGRENAKIYLKEHPDMAHNIEQQVLELYGLSQLQPEAQESETE